MFPRVKHLNTSVSYSSFSEYLFRNLWKERRKIYKINIRPNVVILKVNCFKHICRFNEVDRFICISVPHSIKSS